MFEPVDAFLNAHNLKGPDFDDTPDRVARFWQEFLYPEPPKMRVFPSKCLHGISLKAFTEWGMCPHHLLPVKYTFHVSYIPSGHVLGISKLPRLARWVLRTLPLQEDIPELLLETIKNVEGLDPRAVSVSVEGYHLCMVMRGIRSRDAVLTTEASWYE